MLKFQLISFDECSIILEENCRLSSRNSTDIIVLAYHIYWILQIDYWVLIDAHIIFSQRNI